MLGIHTGMNDSGYKYKSCLVSILAMTQGTIRTSHAWYFPDTVVHVL
jgi:hypothetical protein